MKEYHCLDLFYLRYGDRIPKSIPARLFAFLWTWTGIATIAVITSSMTASLMSMVFKPERMIYGTKVMNINKYNGKLLKIKIEDCHPAANSGRSRQFI